jgi:hypothetical protein
MNPIRLIHKLLYNIWHKYGYSVFVPSNDNWNRFISRRLGGDTGIHGNPKNEYRVTRSSSEFELSNEMRSWATENQIKIKFHITVDNGTDEYVHNTYLNLSFIFLTKADAAQFKLTFL